MARGTLLGERLFRGAMGLLSLAPYAVVAIVAADLVVSSAPVWHLMGVRFLEARTWSLGNQYGQPVRVHGELLMPGASFGAAVPIVGTLLTSALALVLATPMALLVATGTAFVLGPGPRRILGMVVEMMAGIPSVLYGLWGFVVLGPYIARSLGPWLDRVLPPWPFVTGPVSGPTNLLTAGVVLALMVIPIIASTARAVMERVPDGWLDNARALGWTDAEVFRHLVWPYARPAVVGAVILGLGRALGETMAVLMVSGNAMNVLPRNWYSPVATMAATIAGQLDAALQDPTQMAVRALGALGLVLLVISIGTNFVARLLVARRAAVLDGQA
ncbi:MAG: phosphate ABC transporter permease subunit PstC [Actinomycetia bacterium]|nr:phosphate ABC transporter permease subunit PstC [Actinomycetes bacterium]